MWVTRRPHGRYLLTHRPPVICRVTGADFEDAYPEPGERFVVQDICPWGVKTLWPDLDLQPLESARRTIKGE